jgi:hypothetical protein
MQVSFHLVAIMNQITLSLSKRFLNLIDVVEGGDTRPNGLGLRTSQDRTSMGPLGQLHHILGPCVGDDGPVTDLRAKTDIRRIGTAACGLPLYHFKYIGRPEIYEGLMAQDVLQVMPSAVTLGSDGYYRVNYRKLGVKLRRIS